MLPDCASCRGVREHKGQSSFWKGRRVRLSWGRMAVPRQGRWGATAMKAPGAGGGGLQTSNKAEGGRPGTLRGWSEGEEELGGPWVPPKFLQPPCRTPGGLCFPGPLSSHLGAPQPPFRSPAARHGVAHRPQRLLSKASPPPAGHVCSLPRVPGPITGAGGGGAGRRGQRPGQGEPESREWRTQPLYPPRQLWR